MATPGMGGQQLDQVLVVGAEFIGGALVGQVEVAQPLAFAGDGHAQEAGHGRVVGRKPDRAG